MSQAEDYQDLLEGYAAERKHRQELEAAVARATALAAAGEWTFSARLLRALSTTEKREAPDGSA